MFVVGRTGNASGPFLSCFFLYLKTKWELQKQEKIYMNEFKKLLPTMPRAVIFKTLYTVKLFKNDLNTCAPIIAAIGCSAIFSPVHSMYETKKELSPITTSFELGNQPHS